jgi:AraC family transcriptional regulator, ethanolamine operon transcriptional activator
VERLASVAGSQLAVAVVDFSDPTIASSGFELLAMDAVRLQSSPFRARRVVVRLREATVVFHSTNLRVRTRTTANQDQFAYVTFGPHTTGSVNGVKVRSDLMLAVAPQAEAGFVADAGWESITILLPPECITDHLNARHRPDEFRPPRGVEALQVTTPAVLQLFDWGKRLVEAAVREPALFNEHPEERAAAQVALIETLSSTLRTSADSAPAPSDQTSRARSHIVRVAEDYAMSHIGERLYLSDLCKIAGASERALEYAFKEVMGLTPVGYLTRLRLHRVREALQTARQGSTTVSAVALEWGFRHLGEFARGYKELFDELPSDTLRRRPGSPR